MASRNVTLKQIFDKLIEHDAHFTGIDAHLTSIDKTLSSHDKQFANAAAQMFSIEDSIKTEIARLDARISAIDSRLEKMTGDLEKLSQEYHMIKVGLKRIEDSLDALGKRNGELQSEVNGMKDRMVDIENRLVTLESPAR